MLPLAALGVLSGRSARRPTSRESRVEDGFGRQ
jgi:hypothetical protein